MLKLLALFCLLVQVYAGILPSVSRHALGRVGAPRLDGRIIGGTPAAITDAPYQVVLFLDWFEIGAYDQVCGGSIIKNDVIVSAGHCAIDTAARKWRIRAGSAISLSGGQLMQVSKHVIHPQFDIRKLDYDIALYFLTSTIILNEQAAIVPLPAQNAPVAEGALGLVTGWGMSVEDGNTYNTTLQKVTLPIVNLKLCETEYINFYPVTDRMICAGTYDNSQNSCQGDEGGPLTVDGVLTGITSFGRGCGRPESPGVYAKVSAFRTWIDSQI